MNSAATPDADAVFLNVPFDTAYETLFIKLGNPADYEVFVLDAHPYRIDKKLSDYKGRDPLLHRGTSDGMLACLLDMFGGTRHSVAEFRGAIRVLRQSTLQLKRDHKVDLLFRPALFRLILTAATDVAIERGFIPPA